jgi:AraC-like DNA-binding protein
MNAIPVKSKIEAKQLLKISPFKEIIKPTVPHKHADYFELIVLSQGAGFHTIDDQNYEVLPPSIFLLKPGQTHCWDFSRIPKGFVVLFREELLSREGLEIVYHLPAQQVLTNSDNLMELVSSFHQDFRIGTSLNLLKAYLQLILLKVSEGQNHVQKENSQFNSDYYRFKSLINEHFYQLRKIQDYAGLLNITTTQLNNICKRVSGKTPSMLLSERLLLEAKTMLASTSISIKEIAAELEFADTSHFVKFFRLNTNLTPGQYRELAVPFPKTE